MGKRFWTIKAAKDDPKVGELLIYGTISDSTWWGDEVTPKQFKKDLDALGDVDTINVFINSGGGDAWAGQAIYSMLKRHKATINTYVDGIAASAASVIACAGDTVTMPRNSMMMIHNPWTLAYGYADELRAVADMLDKVRDTLVNVYEDKSGRSREDIIAIMDAETWLTAEEALAEGFCDVVDEAKEIAASVRGNTLTINGRKVDLAVFKSFPADKVAVEVTEPDEDNPEPVAEVEQEPTEAPAADEPEVADAAPAQDEKQARLKLLRLRART